MEISQRRRKGQRSSRWNAPAGRKRLFSRPRRLYGALPELRAITFSITRSSWRGCAWVVSSVITR